MCIRDRPYLVFTDTANRALPSWLKDKGLSIHGSNLCTEIFLPTSKDRTAVCCLSSVNLEYYDEWRGNEQLDVYKRQGVRHDDFRFQIRLIF